jgi:hypothetical protein
LDYSAKFYPDPEKIGNKIPLISMKLAVPAIAPGNLPRVAMNPNEILND